MNFTLEQHKFFPVIAWTVFIGFALFVGNLALELYHVTSELAESSNRVEQIAEDNSARLDALEAALEGTAE